MIKVLAKLLKGERIYFSSQFKVHFTVPGMSVQNELGAAGSITSAVGRREQHIHAGVQVPFSIYTVYIPSGEWCHPKWVSPAHLNTIEITPTDKLRFPSFI